MNSGGGFHFVNLRENSERLDDRLFKAGFHGFDNLFNGGFHDNLEKHFFKLASDRRERRSGSRSGG